MSIGSAKSWSSVSESSSSESPQWPPPYINARISALIGDQQFEATLTLWPTGGTPTLYTAYDHTLQLTASVYLFISQNQIMFGGIQSYRTYFVVGSGPTVDVQPPTFNLQNSQWGNKVPFYAQVTMAIAYPEQP